MGLDMYLSRRVRKYRKDDGTMSSDSNDLKFDKHGRSNSVTVTEDAAYWRKANMVHRWFVDNIQCGNDDCGEYDVSKESLIELRDLCMSVVRALDGQEIRVPKKFIMKFTKSNGEGGVTYRQRVTVDSGNLDSINLNYYHKLTKAQTSLVKDILPTANGFFFGNTEYNGCYLMDIIDTIKKIDVVLEEDKDNKYAEYTYRASW